MAENKYKNYVKKRLNIFNFSPGVVLEKNEFSVDENCATECYNLKTSNGVLTCGNGFAQLTLPETKLPGSKEAHLNYGSLRFKKFWRYKFYSYYNNCNEYALLGYADDGYIYFADMFGYGKDFYKLGTHKFNQQPIGLTFRINGKECIGFTSPVDPFLVWVCDEEPYIVEDLPKFLSLCLHNDRLFAIDSEKNYLIRYSSNLNPLDWKSNVTSTSGGTIEVNDYKGMLRNLISFQDNVYIFRDFGISKISGYAANSMFSAVNIYNSSCKIFCSTACVCGDEIYFMAEDGLYKCDGFNVVKVDNSFSNLLKNKSQEAACSCFYNGKYYIACAFNYDKALQPSVEILKHVNNVLIEYDIASTSYNITRGIDITDMLAVKDENISKLLLCMNEEFSQRFWQLNDSGIFDNLTLGKKWQGGKINFGNFDKTKILKEVWLISKYDSILQVETEEQTRTYNISGKAQTQKVRINLSGKYFKFSFLNNGKNFYIEAPQFVFNVEA